MILHQSRLPHLASCPFPNWHCSAACCCPCHSCVLSVMLRLRAVKSACIVVFRLRLFFSLSSNTQCGLAQFTSSFGEVEKKRQETCLSCNKKVLPYFLFASLLLFSFSCSSSQPQATTLPFLTRIHTHIHLLTLTLTQSHGHSST